MRRNGFVAQTNGPYVCAESGSTEGFTENVLVPDQWLAGTELFHEGMVNGIVVTVAAQTWNHGVQVLDGEAGLLQHSAGCLLQIEEAWLIEHLHTYDSA